MLFGGSCKQSVEDVVVSFAGVLTNHSILQENTIINTSLELGSKNWQWQCKSKGFWCMTGNADTDRLPSPANLKSSEWRRTKRLQTQMCAQSRKRAFKLFSRLIEIYWFHSERPRIQSMMQPPWMFPHSEKWSWMNFPKRLELLL